MAETISDPGVDFFDTTNKKLYTSAAFTPSADDILLLIESHSIASGTPEVPTIVDLLTPDLAWTKGVDFTWDGGTSRCTVWAAPVGASPASMTVSVDMQGAATNQTGCQFVLRRIAGATATAADIIAAFATAGPTASNAPTVSLGSAPASGNGTIGGVLVTRNPAAWAPTTGGWAETADSGYATPAQGLEVAYNMAGTQTVAWTGTTATWSAFIVEIEQSGAATNDEYVGAVATA